MSSSDLWMRDIVAKYGLIFLCTVIFSTLISWRWSRFRQHHFKTFLLGFESECAELASIHKRQLFQQLEKLVSHDEVLRSLGRIRILEIGVKTGHYMKFYTFLTIVPHLLHVIKKKDIKEKRKKKSEEDIINYTNHTQKSYYIIL